MHVHKYGRASAARKDPKKEHMYTYIYKSINTYMYTDMDMPLQRKKVPKQSSRKLDMVSYALCMHLCMYVYVKQLDIVIIFVCIRMYVCVCKSFFIVRIFKHAYVHVDVYICIHSNEEITRMCNIYTCIYVCVCVYIYIYIYIYIYKHNT
jgi:hypothetical protein